MDGHHPKLSLLLLASTALSSVSVAQATELPTAPTVTSGAVKFSSPNTNSLSIQQSTPSAIVNWQSFSVGPGGQVSIQQPGATAVMLDRVTGSTPSTIAGQINANGQVYLVNPNGIVITPSGTVNSSGFIASTLGITDQDFLAGRNQFNGSGNSASVSNQGAITIGSGGYAALIGGQVSNSGVITVPMGRVGLGAGEQATLDLSGDGFLQVAMPSRPARRGTTAPSSSTAARSRPPAVWSR